MASSVEPSNGFEDGVNRLSLAEADDDAGLGLLQHPLQELVVLCIVVIAQDGVLFGDADVGPVRVFPEHLKSTLTVTPCLYTYIKMMMLSICLGRSTAVLYVYIRPIGIILLMLNIAENVYHHLILYYALLLLLLFVSW